MLLVSESYNGGVKTYIDTIMFHQEKESDITIQALVSSKRLKGGGGEIEGDYLIEDNLSFGMSPHKLVMALHSLHRMVMDKKIDVVHANSTFAGVLMCVYAFWNRKVFYIYTPHGYYSLKKMGMTKKAAVRFVEKRINNSADLVIHVSPSEEREAIINGLTVAEKCIVVLNGSKDPEANSIRNLNDVFTIVNLARVDDQKKPFEFIEIARKLLEQNLNVQFIWAGNGKYLEKAREKVEFYGLSEQVKFIGFSNEKDKILQESDLFLSTSEYEGLPYAVIEAMSYKLPLLLTDIIGHSDLIEGDKNGLLFKNNEDPAIYEFVKSLIHDLEKRNSLCNHSYRIFNERLNVTQMLKKLVGIYQNLNVCANNEIPGKTAVKAVREEESLANRDLHSDL
ncbi:glycosyltransferase [Metaplanococcus flavidus]|uniref:Glycosyltransferase n=1 Tax=Metaplanococcus flavidus TaxID=569883 RepID=A0ABW3LBB3_9BACL